MDLSIVIVNWNTGPLLRMCLDALPAACRGITYEVFLIDNASTDDSLVRGRGSVQPFQLLAAGENLGFARANNWGIERARGGVVLLLNPDTEPHSDSLRWLVEFFKAHPRAGIVGGKLLNPDGTPQPSVRRLPSVGVLALTLTRVARALPRLPVLRAYEITGMPFDRESRVEQVMGACFAIRLETLQEIGMLDTGYWIWFEEVDYCARARERGWEIWFAPSVEVVHARASSFRQVSPLRRSWWFARSALRYAWLHQGLAAALFLTLLTPVHIFTGLLATLGHVRPGVRRVDSEA